MPLALHASDPAPSAADLPADFDPVLAATALAARLHPSAVERDREGGHAARERDWIRRSGLLAMSVPRAYGGHGDAWPAIFETVRIVARADSALAHLLGFHHLQVAGITLYGNAQQQRHLLTETVTAGVFWGNALNPLDKRLVATPTAGGYVLDGIKSFASGSVGADWLTISAWDPLAQAALIAAVPAHQSGIAIQADWDAFGQRQTDSGNVHFSGVTLPDANVLHAAGRPPTAQTTLRAQIAQLTMTNLYLGLAEGALAAARDYLHSEARPWFASSPEVVAAADDPFVQHRFGQFHLMVRPAQVLADAAAVQLDAAFRRGAHLGADERGRVAIAVAEAKVLAHRASIDIGSQLFELTGARSTSARFGFDRFWRNARVHTLHDPVDYKLRDLGRYALAGTLPEPTSYS